jgi:hypothetical protein
MTEEIWKPVLGYDGLYEVSSRGRVRRVGRIIVYKDGRRRLWPTKIIRQRINRRRPTYVFPQVTLSRGSEARTYRVSILVCEAFHGPRPEGCQCMHLDGNPQNNNISNLAWGTIYENSNEPIRRMRVSEVARRNIPNLWRRGVYDNQRKPCLQYSLSGDFIKEHHSIRDASRATGIDRITISRACRGKLKTSGGYIWKYKE